MRIRLFEKIIRDFFAKTNQTGKNKSRKNLSENNTHNRYTAFGRSRLTVAGGEITQLYRVYNSWRGVALYYGKTI